MDTKPGQYPGAKKQSIHQVQLLCVCLVGDILPPLHQNHTEVSVVTATHTLEIRGMNSMLKMLGMLFTSAYFCRNVHFAKRELIAYIGVYSPGPGVASLLEKTVSFFALPNVPQLFCLWFG
jgi:hypothetical protein